MIDKENIVILYDNKGNELELEFLDLIEYGGYEYAVMAFSDSDEVIIMQYIVNEDGKSATYEDVFNDEVVNKVFEIFKNSN